MLSQIIENTNPTSRILAEKEEPEDDVTYIEGIKNNVLAVYSAMLNEPKNKPDVTDSITDNIGPYINGPNGVMHQNVEYLLDRFSDRNIYSNTTLAQSINVPRAMIETSPKEFQQNMNLLRTGIHDEIYRPELAKYMRTMAFLDSSLKFTPYNKKSIIPAEEFRKMFPPVDIDYVPMTYDKELVDLMKNPIKNIDALRRKLKLNSQTGYYCFDGIPYICKHEFMTYEGKSLKQVLMGCADEDYMCKYCGEALAFTTDDDTIDFDAIQYRTIYLLLESINLISYEDFILFIIAHAISKSIDALELEASADYTEKVDAFTATYIYKLHEHLKKELKLKPNQTLLAFIRRLWSKAGWDDDTVKQLMKNEDRFKHFIHTANIIISFKKEEANKNEDWSITRLFLSVDGPLQKLYKKDKLALGKLVDLMFVQLNNAPLVEYADIIKSTTASFVKPIIEMTHSGGNAERAFFIMWWREICPEHITHEMKNNKCKYCGITKENISSIYDKYQYKIHQLLQTVSKLPSKFDGHTRKAIIDAINKQKDTLNIKEINPEVFSSEYINDLMILLESFVGIGHIEEIEIKKESIESKAKQIINYLLTRDDINGQRLTLEINAIAIPPIPSMGTLVMKF